jgi:hypothetical protein
VPTRLERLNPTRMRNTRVLSRTLFPSPRPKIMRPQGPIDRSRHEQCVNMREVGDMRWGRDLAHRGASYGVDDVEEVV